MPNQADVRCALADPHQLTAPSPWIVRWQHLLAAQCSVLDVACGTGRHMRWFAQRNHAVVGVDRADAAIESAARFGQAVCADIESGPWPFEGQQFGCVLVANYLWRPLLPVLLGSLAPGGVLLYETFAQGNERVGKPSRPDFLLRPGELLQRCAGLQVVAFEQGFLSEPDRFVQRIAAVRLTAENSAAPPQRHAL